MVFGIPAFAAGAGTAVSGGRHSRVILAFLHFLPLLENHRQHEK